jgi:hypothetical protein
MRLLFHGLEAKQSASEGYRKIIQALHAVKRSCAHCIHSLTPPLPLSLSTPASYQRVSTHLYKDTTRSSKRHLLDIDTHPQKQRQSKNLDKSTALHSRMPKASGAKDVATLVRTQNKKRRHWHQPVISLRWLQALSTDFPMPLTRYRYGTNLKVR